MHVGVGYSDLPESIAAGTQAAAEAMTRAGRSDACDLVLLFSTSRHDQHMLRNAVAAVAGKDIPIYGGGAVGIITNENFGYAGDQVGVAFIWLEGVTCNIMVESGLFDSEMDTGERLGQQMLQNGVKPETPVLVFYDAVDRTGGDIRLMMATLLLQGLQKGLGFMPDMAGAGLQADHVCTPASQYTGDGVQNQCAMAFAFSDEIQMDCSIMHGCRPASQYYTVTKADGPTILEINHRPALAFVDELLNGAIAPEEYPFFLMFGIDHGERWAHYNENNYASRLCQDIDKERGGIVMFEPDMIEGTEFQLMYRSLGLDYMKPRIEALFDKLGQDREPVFAVYIDCAGRCAGYGGLDIEDAVVVQQVVKNRVPMLGMYTGVEIAPIGGRSRSLDWTGVFCLFSKSKSGAAQQKKQAGRLWSEVLPQSTGAAVSVEGLNRLCEQNAGKILSLDMQCIGIRHELEQKRRAFNLLAELIVYMRQTDNYKQVFINMAKRINAALNMQKTVVLMRRGRDVFEPIILQGYPQEQVVRLAGCKMALPPEMLNPEWPILVNGADDDARLQPIREMLFMPYFISCPILLPNGVEGVLITGRMAEQPPFLSRLGAGDVETMEAISALMAAVLVRDQLADAEERAHIMLDSSPLCANFWNQKYENVDCNLEAVKLFDLSSKQDYLNRFYELSPTYQPCGRRSDEMAEENIRKAFATGKCEFEWLHQKLNGEPVPSEIKLVRVRYKGEDVVMGYTRDLRQVKAQMAEIERTQNQLREARDRAEESSRAKSNFLANMSHEIRTPMNAIIGMTEIAKNSDDMERIQYCLNKIDDASIHLLGVINDILDMSKIGAGKFTLSETDFALEDMLQRVANVINFKAEERQQNFIIKVDKDVPASIVADRQRLIQVITNLLSNAVKFTPEEGEIRLLVHKQEEEDGECTLWFEVADNGIGITEEQQRRLFRSFEQADSSISRRFGGTGLGLAISKDIVEMMHGRIWVESQPQKGSIFQFTVKVKRGKAKELSRLDPSVHWDNVRVLVVDDAPEVLEYFQDIADSIGIVCKTASSGYEACEMLDAGIAFNIIFVDWKMPGMDGIELARKIRECYGSQVIVVMISAVSWCQIEDQARAAGVDRFISKPLLPSPIVDCINECVGVSYNQCAGALDCVCDDGIFAGKRVLLVEDIEINREIVCALLSDTGIAIDCAENGKEACRMYEANADQYSAILMDIHMPEMDGYQATRIIRSLDLPFAQKVPIIAMTANVFKEDIEKCMKAGMSDHIGKPLDIDELLVKLKRYIR